MKNNYVNIVSILYSELAPLTHNVTCLKLQRQGENIRYKSCQRNTFVMHFKTGVAFHLDIKDLESTHHLQNEITTKTNSFRAFLALFFSQKNSTGAHLKIRLCRRLLSEEPTHIPFLQILTKSSLDLKRLSYAMWLKSLWSLKDFQSLF